MSLFQNAVISKYLQATNQDIVTQKWNEFTTYFHNLERQENIRNSKEEQYQEGFLRELFVKILGYTLNPEPNFNLTTEYKNVKDSKKADGAIIVSEKVRAVIELKGTNTTDLGKIEAQAFGYKNNQPDCTYVITSNFEKIRFYIDNAIEHVEFNLFTLTEAEFKILFLCLAVENISKDIPKKIKEESVSQEDAITKKLYKDYSLFKRELFKNLVELNPQFDQLELFKKSQKLLDRFLFIFFAEDRMLLPPNSVRLILQQWKQLQDLDEYTPLYERFKKYFGYLNTGYKGKNYDVYAYNGGLFKPDEILDNITIDDNLLYDHTIKLSEYDFVSEVDVNILGHIFENSLNELDEIKAQLEGQEIDKTKTKRKKDGVFYTPKYITKYIVENTIGKLCEEKKTALAINEDDYITDKKRQKKTIKDLVDKLDTYRKWLLQLTICDPACGSGAFLNQALDFLIEEHQYIDELQAKLFGDALVLTDMENSILENNLFGVDLNEESVEIAKLSLWLRTAQPNRKLNDLSGNIKCGNSLIDDPEIAGEKAFNWQNAFPKVFEKGGFDVIIGNPPYGASFNNLDKTFIKENYFSYQYKFESYLYFYEKGIEILKHKGFLSYITPELFLRLEKSENIRKLLLEKSNVLEVKFCGEDVFADVKVNSVILTLNKELTNDEYLNINYENGKSVNFLKSRWEKSENYILEYEISDDINLIIENIIKDTCFLGNLGDCIQGLTAYDSYRGQSQEIIKSRAYHFKEKVDDTCGRWLDGKHLNRYILSDGDEWLKYGDWLAAPREPRFFETPRILFREIPGQNKRIQAVYTDEKSYYGHSITPFLLNDNNFKILYILSVVNSRLISWYASQKCPNFSKKTFPKLNPKDIKEFPIKKISIENQKPYVEKAELMLISIKNLNETSSKFQRTLQRKFELDSLPKKLESWYELSFAEFVKELGKKKIKLSLSDEAEWEDYFLQEQQKALALKHQITTTDQEIDKMVYELYGLTDEEIKIVEES
ncbi:restriction endonuclease subunit M [Flavobacterium covae]|uniref:Eco57I restriction-modification methylase domain-containing protein n=1 Tax=Flavobacterium covae TaxID=2906076 RepID=UPI0007C1A242|nr:N-6 DNA methylase [Flavobacterium covae]AND64488.1 restriction endonuclease subunit M [Flavobacterium covae]